MILPYLAPEEQTDLTEKGFPGVIAYWRPLDLKEKARWADKCVKAGVSTFSAEAKIIGLEQQLLRIDGLTVRLADGTEVLFSVKEHLLQLGLTFLIAIWDDIEVRGSLNETDAKNSERPSASPDMTGTASSPAEPAQSNSETNSAAFSPGTNEKLPAPPSTE